MKKLKLGLVAAIYLALINVAQAQTSALKDKQASVHYYMFALSDEFQIYIEDLVRFNDGEPILTEKDSVQELFMHKAYERIEMAIEEKMGLDILPKETLEGKVLYDIYGYPASGKKKAAKRGSTPYYLKVNVQMTARDMIDDEVSVDNNSYVKRKIKPHVSIKVTIFDDDAKPFFKAEGQTKGDKWVVLDQVSLLGFIVLDGQTVVDEQATLLSVLDEAIEDLKTNLE